MALDFYDIVTLKGNICSHDAFGPEKHIGIYVKVIYAGGSGAHEVILPQSY
jgi:hypothetical protein